MGVFFFSLALFSASIERSFTLIVQALVTVISAQS